MRRARLFLSILALAALLAGLIPVVSVAQESALAEMSRRVVRISYDGSREEATRLANTLDVWEVHPDQKIVVALVSPEEEAQLRSTGYQVEIERVLDSGINAPLDPRYYYFDHTYSNANDLYMVDFLTETNAAYPDITELLNIGTAWQGTRPLLVLRVTNEDPRFGPIADKPTFIIHANIHAREVTTAEMAIRYIKYLTSGYNGQGGYGVDPDVTWLVDWNAVYIEVESNPDGRVIDDADWTQYWRKNVDNDDGCTDPNSWGIDLNRNHTFKWGCCGGSSGQPCSDTYRGPARGSEPETQAFQDFVTSIISDTNGPNGDDEFPGAAPLTTTGILLSLHSYADDILWPWGFTPYNTSPNDPQLRKIAYKMAYLSNYNPTGGIGYDVDGDTYDWAYGKLGMAAYTVEVGPNYGVCGDFFPSFDCQDGQNGAPRNFWAENRPYFIYMHKIARTPYMTAYGPDAFNVTATPDPVYRGQPILLAASIEDRRRSGDPEDSIGGAEYFIDQPGADGTGTAMDAQDGSWGDATETAVATIDSMNLVTGTHYILVHGKTVDDEWGPFTAVFVHVNGGPCTPVSNLQLSYTPPVVDQPVHFTGSADGAPLIYYSWAFGDGTTGSGAEVDHTYTAWGDYTVVLTASNGCGPDVVTTTVVAVCGPVQDLTLDWSPSAPVTNQAIDFAATATGTLPIDYSWNMGDGTTGNGATLTHSYSLSGDYTVIVTATNECGEAVETGLVHVCAPVTGATFFWTPAGPMVGDRVSFFGSASGDTPITYTWAFDDGGTGSGPTLAHYFTTPGTHQVTMTATNECGVVVRVRDVTVGGGCAPVTGADFSWSPTAPYISTSVALTATVTGGDAPLTYTWDLGDGTVAAGAAVTHAYAVSGTYSVLLSVTNCDGTTAITATHDIVVAEPLPPEPFVVYLPVVLKGH